MKKITIPAAIIGGCFILGFFFYLSKINKSDNLFTKKQVCASYIEQLKKKFIDGNNNPRHSFLDEVFYSPSHDTCFYSYTSTDYYGASKDAGMQFNIVDYSTNKNIFFASGGTFANQFESKKEELKK